MREHRFYPAWRRDGVGKDLKYRRTSAPLPPCTCLLQAGLRQTRRLQDLGFKSILTGCLKSGTAGKRE
ncbi:MAG: hypothetical protein DRH37_11170 [Deltaproteobacteria bacterium]|nr:MAG: hypothetical protein DRH37_11170 [Deltaproteobacteria bacterium]